MKNYKNLVPIVLVVLFLLGIYMKYDTNASLKKEYNEYLSAAREYKEIGINVDAEAYYLAAADVKPNIGLYVEIGEFYETYDMRSAIDWGEEIVETYPEETQGYEFLLRIYKDTGRYEDFFELYDVVKKRDLITDVISEMQLVLSKEFYLEGKYEYVGAFAEGYCKVCKDNLWSFVDEAGYRITDLNYVAVGDFCDGIAPVKDRLGNFYFIDVSANKKKIIQNVDKIEAIGSNDIGLCTIYDGKTWNVYTLDGELKYGGYSNISTLANGVVAAEKNGKWLLLDEESGEQLIKDTFDNVKQDEKGIVYRNSRLFVEIKGKYYMIDIEGNKIVKTAFEDAKIFNGQGYAAVKLDGKWGFINQDGEIVIEPKYEDARSFSNGYAAVKMDGKWGFIDENNEIFIKCQFNDARDFTSQGSVFVNQGIWQLLRLYSYN